MKARILTIIFLCAFCSTGWALEKNVASQKWAVFCFDRTTNAPKTGDAANITANLRIDGGAANAIDDLNPTELEDGYYIFDLAQLETNGDYILIAPSSTTSNIQCIGVPSAAWTAPPNYNDMAIASSTGRIDVGSWDGTAVASQDTAGYPVVTIKDGTGTGEIDTSGGAIANVTTTASVTNGVTVTTNNDKTGYTVSTVSDKTGYSLAANQTSVTIGSVDLLNANAIQNTSFANAAIESRVYAFGAISHTALAPEAIWDNNIKEGAIMASTFANNAITSDVIANGAITTGKFAAGAIDDSAFDAMTDVEIACTNALNTYDPPTKAELDTAVADVSVDEIQITALADLFNTNSGTTYSASIAGSVVKEIADNAGGGSCPSAATISDAVWDETLSGHTTGDTPGKVINMLTQDPVTLSTDVALTSIFGQLLDDGTAWSYDASTDSQEAIANGTGGSCPSAATIADSVWDEDIVAAHNMPDTAGALLDSPGDWATATGFSTHTAADVWNVAAGSAAEDSYGNILDDITTENATSGLYEFTTAALEPHWDALLSDHVANNTFGGEFISGDDVASKEDIAAAIFDYVYEGTETYRTFTRCVRSIMYGLTTGGGTSTLIFRDLANTKNRVSATRDANKNRISVTIDGL